MNPTSHDEHRQERSMDRRNFLERACLGTAAVVLAKRATQASADTMQGRPRAPFKVLYSNDTTNITSCVSPYHKRRQPFTDDCLRATIDEAEGVDVHLLQPGLGWIPWWQSDVYSAKDHYEYYEREYGIKPNSYGRYLLGGGDLIRTHVEHCRQVGVAPFISYRLNDGHHVRDLEKALQQGRPSQNMSRFYWENYQEYRLGPDAKDWDQGVFNWAVPEVREQKLAFIREICEKYDIAGLELDFLRHLSYFRQEETTPAERRVIMTGFVSQVRDILDRTVHSGQRRWLCVRVPSLLEMNDAAGIDLAGFVEAGVDMINLSSSYFTCQATDLPRVRQLLPETPLYLEMAHTPMTGKALAGSGTQVYQRTTDEQFYTTAHLAYTQGADGVSLFNFVYYREHQLPELGPFHEPPFHVLPRLDDKDWLACQSQWYFLAAIRHKSRERTRRLQATVKPGEGRRFLLEMAPTVHQQRDGILRLMTDKPTAPGAWLVKLNGISLEPTAFVRKPIEHPYEGYLGEAEQYACFSCPRSAVKSGTNEVLLKSIEEDPQLLIYIDVVLP